MTLKQRQLDAIRDELRARLRLAYVSTADELDLVLALLQGASKMYDTARTNYCAIGAAVYAAEMDYEVESLIERACFAGYTPEDIEVG